MAARDPRRILARLVAGLEQRMLFVKLADIERAAARARRKSLRPEQVASVVDQAVADRLLYTDRRAFFDRRTVQFSEAYVYRVNRRHPLAVDI
jgi:hypothetical protein